MLFVFNLDWERFNIAQTVAKANSAMSVLCESAGVSGRITFNCAALGTGEHILPFAADIPQGREEIPAHVLDHLRHHHHVVRRKMWDDPQYRLWRETAEMLRSIKRAGHSLAAVFSGATGELEHELEDARCRDPFEDYVIGYDRLGGRGQSRDDLTSVALYRAAAKQSQTPLHDSIIVADSPEGIEEGRYVKPQAVVGYVPSAEREDVKDVHVQEFEMAGADYTLLGGSTVAALPFLFEVRAAHRAARLDMNTMLTNLLKRDIP